MAWSNLTQAAAEAHRNLLGDGPRARIIRDELAARDIDEDDIRTWGLGCAMADNRVDGIYRGQHLACSWPMLDPTGRQIVALAWRRNRWTGQAELPVAKYAYETGSKPGRSMFGLSRIAKLNPPFAVMPEGWPCVIALQKRAIPAASPIGVTITPRQAQLAAQTCKNWIVMFDKDPDGPKIKQASNVARQLDRHGCEVRIVFMRTVKDPSEDIAQAVEIIGEALDEPPTHVPPEPYRPRRRWSVKQIADLAAHIDLIELVGQTAALHGLRADCPFHGSMGAGRSTQSLAVWQTDDGDWRWHCFSGDCGGGTAVEWIARRDGLDLDEAMHRIARDVGVEVTPQPTHTPRGPGRRRPARLRKAPT